MNVRVGDGEAVSRVVDDYSTIECNLVSVMTDLTNVGQGRWMDKRERAGKRAKQLDQLITSKIVPPSMTEEGAEYMKGFYKALRPVYDLLGSNDAKGMADEDRSAHMDMADKGSKANCAMVNFFIRMEKKYSLGTKVLDLMDKVFVDGDLQRELDGRSYSDLSTGIYAMVVAYLALKWKHPDFNWRGVSSEEDRGLGGDLVGEMDDGGSKKTCVAEVKSGNYVPGYMEFDLDDPNAEDGVLMVARGRRSEDKIRMGLQKIHEIMRQRQPDEVDSRKYLWVYVPAGRKQGVNNQGRN